MVKCCACANIDKNKKRGIRFYHIPNNDNIRALWLENLGLSEKSLISEDVSSDHFSFMDYAITYFNDRTRLRIKNGAVPKRKVIDIP